MTVIVDPTISTCESSSQERPTNRQLAAGRRFFSCDDGISYTVVARDQAHAEQILRSAAIDFPMREAKTKDGTPTIDAQYAEEPQWSEITERASEIRVHNEVKDPVSGQWTTSVMPLDQCDMGEWFSSEW